jgi:hypothetical protein
MPSNSKAAMAARSFDDVCGIEVCEGKNSTVSNIRVPFFCDVNLVTSLVCLAQG